MSGIIGDLIEGIADFFTDVWMARRQRAHHKRPARSLGEDSARMGVLHLKLTGWGLLTLICGLVMWLGFGLPAWMSVLPAVAAVAYGVYLRMRMVRE